MTDASIVPGSDFDPMAMDCGSSSCVIVTCPWRAIFVDCFGDCCWCAPPDWDSSSVAANLSDRADSIPVPEVACTAYPSGSSPSPVVTDPFAAWPAAECTACADHSDWHSCAIRADLTADCCVDADPDSHPRRPSALDYR